MAKRPVSYGKAEDQSLVPTFSIEDLLAEFAGVKHNDEGFTVREYAAMLGHDERWVRIRLQKLSARGKIRRGKRMMEDLGGREQPVNVYRIVK